MGGNSSKNFTQKYTGRVARKEPNISKRNRRKRLQFAKTFVNYDENVWKNITLTRWKKARPVRQLNTEKAW